MKAVLFVVLAVALALPASASAAPITLSAQGTAVRITLGGATRVVVSRMGSNVYIQGGASDTWTASTCTAGSGYYDCGTSLTGIIFVGSAGNDEFAISPDITIPVTVSGGGGDDELNGASGNDTLNGEGGVDIVRGGAGNDTITGGDGTDILLGELGVDTIDGGTGDDTMFGGGQAGDRLSYASRSTPVTVDLAAGTAGAAGESDSVMDFTVVTGGNGNDMLSGGPGADQLDGGNGNDVLSGGPGADRLNGGAGEDAINARDSLTDAGLSCGTGADRLANDARDPAANDCEVTAPQIVGDIAVGGDLHVGGTLDAAFSGTVRGTDPFTLWRWSRCESACSPVAEAPTYTLTASDVGATITATLMAWNLAGTGELVSGRVGPVPPPAVLSQTPPVAAAPVPAGLRVRSARCSGKRCTLSLRLTGDVARVRAVLTRGKTTVASASKSSPSGTVTLRVTAKRTLRTGTYKLKTTVTGKDGKSKSSTRTIKIRRR